MTASRDESGQREMHVTADLLTVAVLPCDSTEHYHEKEETCQEKETQQKKEK